MKTALLSLGIGTHARLLDIARPSFKAYADRHGYDYFEADPREIDRPASWYKVPAMIGLLDSYDTVIFCGADMVIVDGRTDLMSMIHPDAWQALVYHHTNDGEVPNCDMWVAKKALLPYLHQAWEQTDLIMHGWWEQAAMLRLMGYDLSPARLIQANELTEHTQQLDSAWNVHIWDVPAPAHPIIQHATMWPDRAKIMLEWAAQAKEWIDAP